MSSEELTIDLGFASSSRSLHEMFAAILGFPEYYGMNWDAFWDCVCHPDQSRLPKRLVFVGMSYLEDKLPRDARILREQIRDLPGKRKDVEVVINE